MLKTGRRQFKRQGQAIQAGTDGCDGASIGIGYLEVGFDGLCTLCEECHCCILRECFALGTLLQIGYCQRLNDKLVLPTDA